jgi:ABC-type nitrate/sulfonate/bicarbonate transport system permease component
MKSDRVLSHIIASWIGVVTLLVIWQGVTGLGLISPEVFPGPVAVFDTAVANLKFVRVLEHIGSSLFRVIVGFTLGVIAGVILGVTCGWYPRIGAILRTPIELLRPVPPLAWIPLAIIWFGLGTSSKVFIIFMGAFFPIFTNTYTGIRGVDTTVIRAGQMLGLRNWRLLAKVVFPMTLPDIATGMRLGWSYSFGAMVAAEIIAADSGLGYLVMYGRELGLIGIIIFGIILIAFLNLLTDYIIQEVLLKRWLRWFYAEPVT